MFWKVILDLKTINQGGVTLINEVVFFISVAKVNFLNGLSKFLKEQNPLNNLITLVISLI